MSFLDFLSYFPLLVGRQRNAMCNEAMSGDVCRAHFVVLLPVMVHTALWNIRGHPLLVVSTFAPNMEQITFVYILAPSLVT